LAQQLDTILEGSLTDNYTRAYPEEAQAASEDWKATKQLLVQRQFRRQFVINNGFMVARDNPTDGLITIGQQWRGTAENFSQITTVNNVSQLTFEGRVLTADYLEPLRRATSITTLKLAGCQLEAAALEQLGRCQSLSGLIVSSTAVIDSEFIDALRPLSNLYSLTLECPQLDASVFEALPEIKSLSELTLKGIQLSPENFTSLGTIPALSSVLLDGCRFDIASHKAFHERHPEIRIDFIPRAFLGVRTSLQNNLNAPMPWCRIGEVVPGSGADLAGVKPGDIVKKIAGQDVESFDDLRLIVSQYGPGEELAVVVDRNEQILNLTIRLGDRAQINE
jgi:hypothetical protein